MRASRAVLVAGGCAAIVGAGWAVSPKEVPTLDLVAPAGPEAGEGATDAGEESSADAPAAAPTPSLVCEPDDDRDDDEPDDDDDRDDDCVLVTPEPTEPAASPSADGAGAEAPASTSTTTVDGPVVTNLRGDYQARITVVDGEVTAVEAIAAGTRDAESVRINADAIPELSARVLAAQSADVDHVSGASYTSPGFLESVAGAFAQAGL